MLTCATTALHFSGRATCNEGTVPGSAIFNCYDKAASGAASRTHQRLLGFARCFLPGVVDEAMSILQLGLASTEVLTPLLGSTRVRVCLHAGLEYPSGRLKLDAATSMLRVHHIDADDGCNEVGCNIDRIVDNPDGRAAWQPDGEILLCPQLEPEPEPQPEPEPEPEP
jgi:hypothetical protein